MNNFCIFLGSSFKLKNVRKRLGNLVRQLNDEYLNKGIRIKLLIWEDYLIGYSGKHKQDEYIDEMVLPSNLCIFLFSHRVGKFTRMELEAKLSQDKSSAYCYRMPHNGKMVQEVVDELSGLGILPIDLHTEDDACKEIESLIRDKIQDTNTKAQPKEHLDELYFYTTIPDDLKNVASEIGTAFRNFNDMTVDEWNIHCILHPMHQKTKINETDHYIPILKSKVSDEDFEELCLGKEKADERKRMKRMTVFDMENIIKDNQRVHDLLNTSGVFTDKVRDLKGVKYGLCDWVRKERKKLFSKDSVRLEVSEGMLLVNGRELTSIEHIDNTGILKKMLESLDTRSSEIESALSSAHVDDKLVKTLVDNRNTLKQDIDNRIAAAINSTTFTITIRNAEEETLYLQYQNVNKQIESILNGAITNNEASILVKWLDSKYELENLMRQKGMCESCKVVASLLYSVGIYDTYLQPYIPQREEDKVYIRILEEADSHSVNDPAVESIRMNVGNMYARKGEIRKAEARYRKAIENLHNMNNGSNSVKHILTYVYVHLYHTLLEYATQEEATELLYEFRHHISSLDEVNKDFLTDRCMFQTAELTSIDILNEKMSDVVDAAENLYEEARHELTIGPEHPAYGDVFVYLPDMIARYYVDHCCIYGDKQNLNYTHRVEQLIKEALTNCDNLCKVDYEQGLHHKGELLHNLGFMYAQHPYTWDKGLDAYSASLGYRERLLALSPNTMYMHGLAHTLFNAGGLELDILANRNIIPIKASGVLDPLGKADKVLTLTSPYIGNPAFELLYHQALQLKGSCYEQIYEEHPQDIASFKNAMECYFLCWNWAKDHISNQYRIKFLTIAGQALLKHHLISIKEYEEVKLKCLEC